MNVDSIQLLLYQKGAPFVSQSQQRRLTRCCLLYAEGAHVRLLDAAGGGESRLLDGAKIP